MTEKKKAAKAPEILSQLGEDPENPRQIDPEAKEGLAVSVKEFGDLSGITWNQRTGELVSGHQRVQVLRETFGDLEIKNGKIETPGGSVFHVRVVDWEKSKQRAANLAANNHKIGGTFTDQVAEILRQCSESDRLLFESLRLDDLEADLDLSVIEDEAKPVELEEIPVEPPPPSMTWVLMGIPTVKFGRFAEKVREISEDPEVVCEMTANSDAVNGASEEE